MVLWVVPYMAKAPRNFALIANVVLLLLGSAAPQRVKVTPYFGQQGKSKKIDDY